MKPLDVLYVVGLIGWGFTFAVFGTLLFFVAFDVIWPGLVRLYKRIWK